MIEFNIIFNTFLNYCSIIHFHWDNSMFYCCYNFLMLSMAKNMKYFRKNNIFVKKVKFKLFWVTLSEYILTLPHFIIWLTEMKMKWNFILIRPHYSAKSKCDNQIESYLYHSRPTRVAHYHQPLICKCFDHFELVPTQLVRIFCFHHRRC